MGQTVQIITDSTCTLPPDTPEAVRQHVRVVRTAVQFGSETWVEGSFTLEQFYARVQTSPTMPRSSQPAPEEFLRVFGEAASHGPVLAILLSAALSGTYSTAVALAQALPDADIALFDSGFFSSALGYLVAEAAAGALAGSPREELIERLRWRRERTALFVAVDSLAFLRRSGRVNLLQAGLASALDLKPVLAVQQGRLVVVRRVRSRQRSLHCLLDLAAAHARTLDGPVWVSAMHGHAAEAATWLLAQMAQRLLVQRRFVSEAPASIALHGGPGVVGVAVTPGAS